MNLRGSFKNRNGVNLVVSVVLMLIEGALMIFVAYLCKMMMDIVLEGSINDLKRLILLSGGYIVTFYLVSRCGRFFRNRYLWKASVQYKETIFRAVLGRGVESDVLASNADFHAGLTLDMDSIEVNYILGGLNIFYQSILFGFGLVAMLYLSVPITLFVLVSALVPTFISMYYSKRISKLERATSDENVSFISVLSDLLAGFSVIKVFHVEKEALKLFKKSNCDLEVVKIKRRVGHVSLELGMFISGFLITVGLGALGVYLTLQKIITLGTVIAFLQLMDYVVNPAGAIGGLVTKRRAAGILIDKTEDNLKAVSEVSGVAKQDAVMPDTIVEKDILVVDNVSLIFPESDFSLANVDFTFERGKHYVIIGSSGSGKSTVLKLLLGFYSQYTGKIIFEGVPLAEIDRSYLYNKVAYVQQSTFIFNDSILNNVTLYRDHSVKNVQHALSVSGLDAIVESRGDSYQCGVNGKHISGGETQRIALARALLAKPELLILDEATSALDQNSNQAIMDMVLTSEGLSSISIMHRVDVALLKKFDCILIMDKGKLKIHGSYAELSKQGIALLDVLV